MDLICEHSLTKETYGLKSTTNRSRNFYEAQE